jgi:hypothetical protein
MVVGTNIGRKDTRDERNGMITNTTGRGKYLGSRKNRLMFGEDELEVRMHRWYLSGLNGMELCNNC